MGFLGIGISSSRWDFLLSEEDGKVWVRVSGSGVVYSKEWASIGLVGFGLLGFFGLRWYVSGMISDRLTIWDKVG